MTRPKYTEEGLPTGYFSPNDWCGNKECSTCEGVILFSSKEYPEIKVGDRIALYWSDNYFCDGTITAPYCQDDEEYTNEYGPVWDVTPVGYKENEAD